MNESDGIEAGVRMFERCTPALRKAVFLASYEALTRSARRIAPEHLLLGLLREDTPELRQALPPNFNLEDVRQSLSDALPKNAVPADPLGAIKENPLPLSEEAKQVIREANASSLRLGHSSTGLEHLAIGLTGYVPALTKRLGIRLSARRHLALFGFDLAVAEGHARILHAGRAGEDDGQ